MEIDQAFRSAISEETLENLNSNHNTTYAIDRDYRVVFHNDGWERFARENNGARVLVDWAVGARIDQAIPQVLLPFYYNLYDRAFRGEVTRHVYHCHSGQMFRKFQMTLYPVTEGARIIIDNSLVVEKGVESEMKVAGMETESNYFDPTHNLLTQCAHCRRVRDVTKKNKWDFAPWLVEKPSERISHGLCSICFEYYYKNP